MDEFIEFSAVVETKGDLQKVFKHRGNINSDNYQFGSDVWAPCSLVLLGFAGAHEDDGKYHGVYRFRPSQPRDEDRDTIKIGDLPGIQGNEPVYRQKRTRNIKNGSDTHTDKIVG